MEKGIWQQMDTGYKHTYSTDTFTLSIVQELIEAINNAKIPGVRATPKMHSPIWRKQEDVQCVVWDGKSLADIWTLREQTSTPLMQLVGIKDPTKLLKLEDTEDGRFKFSLPYEK